jgi:hypothetical protein
VLNRIGRSDPVTNAAERLGTRGPLFRCGVVELEFLRGVAARQYKSRRMILRTSYPELPITAEVIDRALEVQSLLADDGQHQGVKVQDLIIAACAELNDAATVLHYDTDYDAIAAVTGQPAQWVVQRGTAD